MKKISQKSRFLVGFSNPAGIGTSYAATLRALGYEASHVSYWPHAFSYEKNDPQDFSLNLDKKSIFLRQFFLFWFFLKALFKYDVFIFLFSDTFFMIKNRYFPNLDIPVLKLFGKRVIMVFVGCDIRLRTAETFSCTGCEIICDNLMKARVAKGAEKYASVILAQPDYVDLFKKKKYHYFWIPLNLEELRPTYQVNKKPLIVHAPSHRGLKGTKYLLLAVRRLKKEKYAFDFKLLENKPHQVLLDEIRKADIVVDSLFGGWYGVFAAEAMALGKPVIGYISQENIRRNGFKPPMISANPDSIETVLRKILKMKESERIAQGKKARRFIEKNHDEISVVKAMLKAAGK